MNDETEYRNALKQFLTGAGKVKISAALQQMIQDLPLTDQNILKIMNKTIDDRQAYKNKLANAPKVAPTAQPTPPTPPSRPGLRRRCPTPQPGATP